MVTKKGTPVKKTKDVNIAANVMADSIKTEELRRLLQIQ